MISNLWFKVVQFVRSCCYGSYANYERHTLAKHLVNTFQQRKADITPRPLVKAVEYMIDMGGPYKMRVWEFSDFIAIDLYEMGIGLSRTNVFSFVKSSNLLIGFHSLRSSEGMSIDSMAIKIMCHS